MICKTCNSEMDIVEYESNLYTEYYLYGCSNDKCNTELGLTLDSRGDVLESEWVVPNTDNIVVLDGDVKECSSLNKDKSCPCYLAEVGQCTLI